MKPSTLLGIERGSVGELGEYILEMGMFCGKEDADKRRKLVSFSPIPVLSLFVVVVLEKGK